MDGLQFVTIPLSGTVSTAFSLRNTPRVGIHAPGQTSCQLILQGSRENGEDPSSGSFANLFRTDGSTPAVWNVGSASGYFPAGLTLVDAVWGRLISSVAQAQVNTYTIITQAR